VVVPAASGVTLVDVLTPSRGAAVGARLTGVALAVAALLAAPVAATAGTARETTRGADVVGGPGLAERGVAVAPLAGAAPLPAVDADTWLLADLTTGEVLAAKGAHTKVLPASTLKTLTVVTLMPKLDKQAVVTATWKQARADGGHVGIVPGATYTIWDLWHGLLLPSANDAAAALADANGGMTATVRDMQAMATHLQAADTTVRNDSGLDAKGQVSSAYDMALFARAALEIPDFRTVTKTFHYPFPGRPVTANATRKTYQIYTQNRLLVHGYKGVIGGKTGFTSLAHRTYWGAATRGGHTLVVTLFQIHEPTETAARTLLDWGFANRAKVSPVGTLVAPLDAGSPGSTAGPTASAVGGGGTTASGGSTAASSGGIPWKPVATVVLVLALAAAGVLWWRRRSADRLPPRIGSHEPTSTPLTVAPVTESPVGPSSDVPVPPVDAPVAAAVAPAPPTRPTPAGHVRIITPPGRPPTS
jgi:D-alanyl-D-alanine carboxypeptidase (penicillin-binding protein 5/6)